MENNPNEAHNHLSKDEKTMLKTEDIGRCLITKSQLEKIIYKENSEINSRLIRSWISPSKSAVS